MVGRQNQVEQTTSMGAESNRFQRLALAGLLLGYPEVEANRQDGPRGSDQGVSAEMGGGGGGSEPYENMLET